MEYEVLRVSSQYPADIKSFDFYPIRYMTKSKQKSLTQEEIDDDILCCVPRLLRDFKRVRDDVALRKKEAKAIEFTVVKTSWNSFCKDPGKALTGTLETAMLEMDKTLCEAYILANLHICRLCEDRLVVPKLNQEFFYSCLSAVSSSDRQKKEIVDSDLRTSVALYETWRPRDLRKPDSKHLSSGLHQNASLQMATNAQNMVQMTFYGRFSRYLRHRYHLTKKEAYDKLSLILSQDPYRGDDEIVTRYNAIVPRGNLSSKPELCMPLLHKFAKYAEVENAKLTERVVDKTLDERAKLVRLFSLLPHKGGFGASHVKICGNGLFGLLKRSGCDVKENDFKRDQDDWWKRLFAIEKFETETRRFAGEILTDGVGVSIVLKKPKNIPEDDGNHTKKGKKERKAADIESFDISYYDQVWGLDPGRRDLFVATDVEHTSMHCSSKEFYHDAKYKESVRKNRRWTDKDAFVTSSIRGMPSKKTAMLSTLKRYVDYLLPKLETLLIFYARRRIRSLKFKRFIYCQKKLHSLCKRLTERSGKRTIVGFGDWSNQNNGTIKKCQSGPVKRLEKELKRYCRVVSIDEYRTSKTCNSCHGDLSNARKSIIGKDFKLHHTKIHGVLHCRNSECENMTVNRDVNASKNIRDLLIKAAMGEDRPDAFRRGPRQ